MPTVFSHAVAATAIGAAMITSDARYFFPWRPIVVSPIGIGAFLSRWGVQVMSSELRWIWLPAAVVVSACELRRARAATLRRLP